MKKEILLLILIILSSCHINKITQEEKHAVINKLDDLMKIDQKYAGIPPGELIEKYGNEEAWEIFKKRRDSVAIKNQQIVKEIFNSYGFIGEKNFNKSASKNFWLIVQHADDDIQFQDEILKVMHKELKKGNANKQSFAMLEDRINVNKGKKQRFGSQLTYNKFGQAIPINGLIDSINVESLRTEFNLPSFKNYYNEMTIMHFEMNEEYYKSEGINKPILYK